MPERASTLTRRQLLRSAGFAAAGLTLGGALDRTLAGSSSAAAPPRVPGWRSRPDLRIPALRGPRNERGASSDPIFFAPYNAPDAQAGAVIAASDGEAIWEHPLAEKVTTNF